MILPGAKCSTEGREVEEIIGLKEYSATFVREIAVYLIRFSAPGIASSLNRVGMTLIASKYRLTSRIIYRCCLPFFGS
jgi:hypothetical protein